jgi:hypothetical protein
MKLINFFLVKKLTYDVKRQDFFPKNGLKTVLDTEPEPEQN